jgi:O-antigen ligase
MHRFSAAPTAGHARGPKRSTALLIQASLLLVSLAVGRAVVETQAIEADALEVAAGAVGVMVALTVMLLGPTACIAALVALAVLPLLPAFSVGGGVDLFAADAFYGALVCWWAIRAAGLGGPRAGLGADSGLQGAPVLLFLGYAGLTLLYVAAVDPGRLPISSVSWGRLVQTASLGWLAATFLRTRKDVTVVLAAIAVAGGVAVILALVGSAHVADAGPLGARGGGIVNPNQLGLVCGLMILIAAFGALGSAPIHRLPLGLLGAVGLVQSRSVGSLVGTSVALLLALAFVVPPARRIIALRALRAALVLVVAVAVAYGLASLIRPENLPTSPDFRSSSAGARVVLGAAGLELVERNPVIGVGWRRSEEPAVIGDPDLNAELRARFRGTKSDYFPDVSPGSVHNAYIQVAADLGLIGLALLILVFVSIARGVGAALGHVERGSPEWRQLWVLAWGLVLIVVWWNDNPIYGGQAETVILAVFVGAIIGLSQHARRRLGGVSPAR